MIEHPVPQNVTSYQFHLIGNMTIKQFLLLLVGVGAAVLIYTTNLPGIIKWPLILIGVLIGVAMAFVPYEERSLDQWILNFAKAMYRPTKFFWRRMGKNPEVFTFEAKRDSSNAPARPNLSATSRERRVNQYLTTISSVKPSAVAADPLDLLGQDTSSVDSLFNSVEAAKDVVPSEAVAVKPNLQVRSRPLHKKEVAAATQAPRQQAINVSTPAQTSVTMEVKEAPIKTVKNEHSRPVVESLEVLTIPAVEKKMESGTAQSDSQSAPANLAPEATTAFQTAASTSAAQPSTSNTQPVVFNRQLPFPSLPDQPNILIGMVYDANGAIMPNAILEILNEQGNTVRALKTNSLGQFYTSTPLAKGNYTIEIEKEGYSFPRFSLQASDTVLDPIEIRPNT